jgi:hypothetical protein
VASKGLYQRASSPDTEKKTFPVHLIHCSFFTCLQLKSEDILLRGLKWSKLLDPEKKGQWWLSGDVSSTPGNIEDVATVISKEVVEAQKLVQLAAAQRMNTDIRRAIFCIIMSAEDYIDAFDKILRLDLSGKQVCIFFFVRWEFSVCTFVSNS